MWSITNDEIQQCFIVHEPVETSIQKEEMSAESIKVNLNQFHQQLPANELRPIRRPQNMAARTFFLDRSFYLLRNILNQPCIQSLIPNEQGKLKLKIANNDNLSLQQYFLKKKFRCLYNRLETYRNDCKSFIGKLKGIDSLIDYNQKSFKELQDQNYQTQQIMQDKIDADFECGNICRVYVNKEEEKEYFLLIENDLNTYGYNNWFFFRVRNCQKGIRRFTIANLLKKTSFFNQGLLISIFSVNKNKFQSMNWFKGGNKVTFSNINFIRDHHANDYYSSLSFEYDFEYDNDEVYFTLNQPYTYTRLINFIKQIEVSNKNIEVEVKNVGYTISNNIIPALQLNKLKVITKEIILILARQHPCETVGSFIAEGIVKSLLEQNPINHFLFNNYEFVIIPMGNPDGVIHGSSRCNMSGLDLNRQWGDNTIKELTPQAMKIKQFIYNLTKNKKIKYMIDLHGHGKKLNSFFFSCKGKERDNIRLFSMSMKKLENRFNIYGCTYGISKDKQNTIRSKINNMGISHSYTLQTSLYGWKDENNQIKHFNEEDYRKIAKSLLDSIFLIEADQQTTMTHLGITKEILRVEMTSLVDVIEKEEKFKDNDNDILSDSDPDGDKLDVDDLLGKCQNKILKKRIQEEYQRSKKSKTKRVSKDKNRSNNQSGRFSSKNMRQSCPAGLNFKSKLSSTSHAFSGKEDFHRPETSNKKVSFSEKWKSRRMQIQKKKIAEQQIKQELNINRLNLRTRIKTQLSSLVEKKKYNPPQIGIKTVYSKKRPINYKMKTQFKEVADFSIQSEEQIKESQVRKSALQIKFQELKQQSINIMLTDTLSILKIGHGEQQKGLSPQQKHNKHLAIKTKNQHLNTEPVIPDSYSKTLIRLPVREEGVEGFEKQSIRYKKFRQFLNNGISSKKIEKSSNSVFYYFPVL